MQFQRLIYILSLLLILCSCEEAASNRKKGSGAGSTSQQTITAGNSVIVSGIHRERGKEPVTYSSEIELNSRNDFTRAIPDSRLDDEGADGLNSKFANRPTVECGLGRLQKLKEKIAECYEKNAGKAIWSGTASGSSAEATWKLVSMTIKAAATIEVWQDTRTGMLWSDVISKTANWCQASGNESNDSAEVSINCNDNEGNDKLCPNLNLVELPKVIWRLPTRIDYLQADIDGIRFVLQKGNGENFWTATTATAEAGVARQNAWSYNFQFGNLLADKMTNKKQVRCIGTSNF